MKEEKYLDFLKEKYEGTEPPVHLKLYGWQHILTKIGPQEKPALTIFYRFAFAGLTFLVLAAVSLGIYKTAQAALPGNPLYSVKLLSESIINKANGNNQASIDNRAQEIVIIAKQNAASSEELKTVVSQYTQSVQSATIKSPTFQKKLEYQHKQFDNLAKDSPQVANFIKDAIEISDSRDHGKEGSDNSKED